MSLPTIPADRVVGAILGSLFGAAFTLWALGRALDPGNFKD